MNKNLKQSTKILLAASITVAILCILFYMKVFIEVPDSYSGAKAKIPRDREQLIASCIQTSIETEAAFKSIPRTNRQHCEYVVSGEKAPKEFRQQMQCALSMLMTEGSLVKSEDMVLCFCQHTLSGDSEMAKKCFIK